MSLSMMSPKEVAFRSATYFERKGLFEKAIRLFIKAGAIKKANSLAEKHNLTELITTNIVEDQSEDDEDIMNGGDKTAINERVNQLMEAGKF